VIDTLDPKALAEVIGPDTIQTPPANNARSTARGSAAQSVTLRRGLGGVGDASENANAQGGGQPAQQRGKFAGADVAQKLQSILQGLERKGFGPGGGGEGGVGGEGYALVGDHTAKRSELQQLHSQVEAQLNRFRSPPSPGNTAAHDAEQAIVRANHPDLVAVEQQIARKLAELEHQLAVKV